MSNQSADNAPWTVLAHLLRPQGRKGELLAELSTDFPERFPAAGSPEAERTSVFLAPPGFAGTEAQARAAEVTNHWLPVGRNHGRIVLTLEGVDSIDKAEALAGLDVIIPTGERVELEDDSEYISELVGCVVFDGPVEVGTVTGVEFPATPDGNRRLENAAPLLNVETATGHEVLIPYVQAFLTSLDITARRIQMHLPRGLRDLNRTSEP